ncbi:MAG: hypothetical protein JW931_01710 [Methanomicrobiaceae archaeon]|nr:hypothetical protein [Methanomicrobiaceae archaeon]
MKTDPSEERNGPVSIVTTHYVKPECMKEFEEEIGVVSRYFSCYPGYPGVNFFRPADPSDRYSGWF